MSTPLRLLDLCCGAGGAAAGYYRSGYLHITGVDIAPQDSYPYHFVQADAMEFLASVKPGDFDLIHASPPCQGYSWSARRWKKEWPDLLAPVRAELQRIGIPWVIENVIGAPFSHYVELCGEMFGLRVIRHRRFETSHLLFQPPHVRHRSAIKDGYYLTIAGHGGESRDCRFETWKAAMGMPWVREKRELCEAIPPAYTTWIGQQMRGALA